MPGPSEERSTAELFGDLARETSTLIRQEMQLAKIEITSKAREAGRAAGLLAGGAVFAIVALVVLAEALLLGLGHIMPLWLSALLVGLMLVGIAYTFIQKGRTGLRRIDPALKETANSLKENKQWANQLTR